MATDPELRLQGQDLIPLDAMFPGWPLFASQDRFVLHDSLGLPELVPGYVAQSRARLKATRGIMQEFLELFPSCDFSPQRPPLPVCTPI